MKQLLLVVSAIFPLVTGMGLLAPTTADNKNLLTEGMKPTPVFYGESAINTPEARLIGASASASANEFAVDFVLPWTDGTSAVVQRELAEVVDPMQMGGRITQFDSLGTEGLRFSLRSLLQYAPFVRRVHIVVPDEQEMPAWLISASHRINIVKHSQIFERPEKELPTFNALAVEANIHRVPGLADHFVLIASGMYMSSSVQKTEFFTKDGKPIQFFEDSKTDNYPNPQFTVATANSVTNEAVEQYLAGREGQDVHKAVLGDLRYLPHFRAMRREDMEATAAIFSQELATTSHHKVAHASDLSLTQLTRDLAFAEHTAVLSHWNEFDIAFASGISPVSLLEQAFADIRATRPKLLSVDTGFVAEGMRERLVRNLESVLPMVSAAENVL